MATNTLEHMPDEFDVLRPGRVPG